MPVASASGGRSSRVRKDRSSLQARAVRWLHTHTADGINNIESPVRRTFTLGDFFAIWGQPLSSTQVATAQGPVIAYLNGVRWSADPDEIRLEAHDLVQSMWETKPRPTRSGSQPDSEIGRRHQATQ